MPLPDWEPQEAAAVDRMLDPNGEPPQAPPTLLDLARLQTRWRSTLQLRRPGPLDLDRMVQALARTEWPVPLPQRARAYRIHDLHLCVDTDADRQLLMDDYFACVGQLIACRADARISLHSIEGPWCWQPVLDAVAQGHAVLLLAEPRLMAPVEQRKWRDMQARLVARGATVLWSLDWRPEAWPGTTTDVILEVPALRETSDAIPNRPIVADADLSRLLACLSPALTVEPALVRELIQTLRLPGGLALEHAIWCHPDLDGALPFRQWHAGPKREHLQRLQQQPPDVIDVCWRVLVGAHTYCHQVQRDEELLNWADAAGEAGIARRDIASEFDQAKLRYARVVRHLLQLRDHADAVGLTGVSSPGVIRAAAMERFRSLPDCLGADRHHLESLLLQAAQPHGTGSSIGTSVGEDTHAPLSVWLFQQGQRLLLVPIDFVGPGVHMTTLSIDTRWLIIECDGERREVWRPRDALAQGPIVLAEWERIPPKSVRVRGVMDQLRVDRVERPHWAAQFALQPAWAGLWVTDRSGMGWGTDGLFHWPDGNPVALEPSAKEGVIYSTPNGWQFEIDRYGPRLSYDFSKESPIEALRVYFRYIPPGTYLQGSPQGIGQDHEHPQHPVTLSQGLWLAETPCTQALWQAVMGKNPSDFKQGEDALLRPVKGKKSPSDFKQGEDDFRHPVEQVSWDDVQTFLKALQPLLPPGCKAVLPTESQWEYACRAGTQTEYWWGDEPGDTRANWYHRHEGTTPVDRYPPNPWGLYDMHGNVYEWCADGLRNYADAPERDPEGPNDGDGRVVRGGSWINLPHLARVAFRSERPHRYAYLNQGFRFALRSPSGPEARPGGLGASRRGGAFVGRTAGADAPAAEPPRRDADDGSSPE